MSTLALRGGAPVRRAPFPVWPVYDEDDLKRVCAVVESRNWGGFPFPNRVAGEFARDFAYYHGAAYGLAVANGTVALQVALQSIDLRFGDEVIVPAYTWDGTAAAVLFAGGVPVFVDVREDTLCLDVERVEAAVTPRTRALLPVHLAMRFADMDALGSIAQRHHLAVIEDCAHVHGGAWKGHGAGSMGDLGCFSLQSSKLMTAGEGGVIITSRLDRFELAQSYTNCGRATATDRFGRRVVGSNFRITELQAALLVGQLGRLHRQNERRARSAARLTAGLRRIPNIEPLPPDPRITREAIYNYVFRYRPEHSTVSRDLFVAALDAEGIPCDGRFYEPVYKSALFPATPREFPQLGTLDYSQVQCPVAERLAYEESVWIPQFLLLGDAGDVDDILTAVEKVATHLDELGSAAAGVKSLSRAERPRVEKDRQY
ncbi:MAG: DegT/DnrJ/EryC1/StrS family aminotransferase [Acidobacteria bacterium]|nr:DegT/DnrJ/EryC1/StrS family aminotransferase [Acidobacteriota bacterium]